MADDPRLEAAARAIHAKMGSDFAWEEEPETIREFDRECARNALAAADKVALERSYLLHVRAFQNAAAILEPILSAIARQFREAATSAALSSDPSRVKESCGCALSPSCRYHASITGAEAEARSRKRKEPEGPSDGG